MTDLSRQVSLFSDPSLKGHSLETTELFSTRVVPIRGGLLYIKLSFVHYASSVIQSIPLGSISRSDPYLCSLPR